MSALSIQIPFPVFQNRDGQPLDNGYVWIGQLNLNPQTNPVQVYFDRAQTQLAQQPLRTINGYVSNAGTPAQLYINETNFSILVQDKNGSMVYNFPDGNVILLDADGITFTGFKNQSGYVSDLADNDGSDWIGFKPAGANAIAASVQDKLRQTISVKDFGATGDGIVTNEQPFIQAAIDAVAASGGGTVLIPKGNYKITAQIVLKPGVALVGDGSSNTIIDHATTSLTAIATPSITPTSLTQSNNLLQGQTTNTITNTCSTGDFINYKNSNLFSDRWAGRVVRNYYYEAELFEVASATGSAVTFTEGATINAPVASTLAVEFFTPNSGFKIQGITIRKSSAVINYSKGLYIQYAKNVLIDDVATENYDDSGIQIDRSMYVQATNTRHLGGSVSLGLCYGTVYVDGAKHCTQDGVIGRKCRHVVANGGTGYSLPMHCTINNIQATESQSHAVDCHGNSAYFVFSNITADNGTAVAGLGHQVINAVAFANNSETLPYEGGLNIFYNNYTVQQRKGIGCDFYTNENCVNSTFQNIIFKADAWDTLTFRSGSVNNTFKNMQLICTSTATATSSANAGTFFTVNSRGILGITYDFCLIDRLYIEGFPWGIAMARPDATVTNVFMQDCGYSGNGVNDSAPAQIYMTEVSRSVVQNVNIYNKNANLTWNGRFIRIQPTVAIKQVTLENIFSSLTPSSPTDLRNFYMSFINANVSELFLKNIRLEPRTGANDFNATSGKYIYQTLTTDN